MITEIGQIVQPSVEEEHKPEPGHVQTQLQLMVVQIVLGRQQKLGTATLNLVKVNKVYKRVLMKRVLILTLISNTRTVFENHIERLKY